MRGNQSNHAAVRRAASTVRPLTIASAISGLLAGAVGAQAPPPPASAGPQLEEIIVTAQKREENLQSVPVSIQALDSKKLEQLQVSKFDDYLKYLPSLSSQSYGPGQSQLYVRGVTNGGDGLQVGSQPLVGLYLDEQPVTTIANNLDVHIYDIARVEQLSGPQGTLFGSSSMAGTVRLITNKPDPKAFAAGYSLTGESIRSQAGGTVEGFVNVPLADNAAIRLVGFSEHDGGYINNVLGPQQFYATSGVERSNASLVKPHYNDVDTYGGRAALKVNLEGGWSIMPTFMGQQTRANGQFSFNPALGDLNVARYAAEGSKDRWWQAALTVQGQIANFDLIYAGGYLHRTFDSVSDYSEYSYFYDSYYHSAYAGTACPGPQLDPQHPDPSQASACESYYGDSFRDNQGNLISPAQTTVTHNLYTKQSHELRLSSPKDRRFRFVAGLFFQRQTGEPRDEYRIKDLAAADSITGQPGVIYLNSQDRLDKDQAAFTELSYDLTPKLTATAGLRYFKYTNSVYGFFGYNGLTNFSYDLGPDATTGQEVFAGYFLGASGESLCTTAPDPTNPVRPCINIDSVVSDHGETHKLNLTYKFDDARMIYATLSTGFRPGGVNRVRSRPPYTPDYLTNIEVGWKTGWLDRRVRFNGAVFLERWKDAQFAISGQNGITEILNAGRAEIRGVESDLQWAVSGNFTLSASATLLHTELKTNACNHASDQADCGSTDNILAPVGTRLPVSPRIKANLIARYQFHLAGFDAHFQGAMVAQSDVVPALEVANVDILGKQPGYSSFDFSAGLAREHWTAELYADNAFDKRGEQSRYSACSPSVCANTYVWPIKPRTIGLTFSQKF
jgi:outer membrane receptor protein involved in Fe transport